MKIHRLGFKNINSLRGEHAVDFDAAPLKEAGLFAITGPTGAGKTTLLDVISLALYNRIPRLGAVSKRVIEEQGVILTENTDEAWAEVEYSTRERRYTSRWSISKARTGNLKDYHMEVFDHQEGKLLDLKKSEVAKQNEDLIGLEYEQFIRSMMLAQGEFARFLKTGKKERGNLLESITGSAIYRMIGQKAFEKHKEHGQELEKLLDREKELEAEKLPEPEFEALEGQLKEADEALSSANQQKQEAQQALKEKEQFLALAEEVAQLEQQQIQAKEAWASFEAEKGPRLQKHEALLPQAESLTAWKQAKEAAEKLQGQQGMWEQKEETAMDALKQATAAIQKVVGSQQAEENLLGALENLEQRVGALQEERNAALTQFKTLNGVVSPLASRLGLEIDLKDPSEGRRQALEHQKKLQIAHIRAAGEVPAEWAEAPEEGQEAWQAAQDRLGRWKQIIQGLEQVAARKEKYAPMLEQLASEEEALPAQIEMLQERVGRLESELAGLKKDQTIYQLQAQVEDLRPKLVAGEPCPLCGATDHPYATHLPEQMPTYFEHQITEKDQALRQADAQLAQKLHAQSALQSRKVELEAELQELADHEARGKKELAQVLEGFADEEMPDSPQAWQEVLERQKQALKTLVTTQSQMEQLRELVQGLADMETVVMAGREVASKIKALYEGEDIRQEANRLRGAYERAGVQLHEAQEGAARWRQELKNANQAWDVQATALESPLRDLGYASPADAVIDLLGPAEFAQLTQQANTLKSAIASLQEKLADRHARIAKQPKTLVAASMEQLREALTAMEAQMAEKQRIRDEYYARKVEQLRRREELATLSERIATQKAENEQWVLLKQYIGDAKGEKFSSFAQDLTLQHLVNMANRRLANLSARYLLAMPDPDPNKDDSLVVLDQDLGQMRRSVKTLSGGESFLISLSLALGLSDLASQEVEINSLFIDEGFGTLDPETLDLTLDTLEKLQAEGGKTIGVISHVEALKERISTQIVITPNGQGFSSLVVK